MAMAAQTASSRTIEAEDGVPGDESADEAPAHDDESLDI